MIPEKHRQELEASGVVAEIFGPGNSINIIVEWINETMAARKGEKLS